MKTTNSVEYHIEVMMKVNNKFVVDKWWYMNKIIDAVERLVKV